MCCERADSGRPFSFFVIQRSLVALHHCNGDIDRFCETTIATPDEEVAHLMLAMRERAGRVVPHAQVVEPLRDEVAERARRDIDERFEALFALVPAITHAFALPLPSRATRVRTIGGLRVSA